AAKKDEAAPKQEKPSVQDGGSAAKADAQPAARPQAEAGKGEAGGGEAKRGERVFASPLARRMAKEAGVDLSAVSGSGPHGRVVKADVAAVAAGGAPAAATQKAAGAAAPAAARPMPDDQVLKLFEEGSYDLVPHDNMRKTIARRLVEAKSTIPHFYLTLDCEIDAMLALRKELNRAAPTRKTEA